MNPQDPLAALHPLREPDLIGWWPLAPGWWVVIAVLLLLLIALAIFCWRRYQVRAYRRQALRQLEAITLDLQQSDNHQSVVQSINQLLKATALRAYPRRDVAAISGEAWLTLLNETMGEQHASHAFPTSFAAAGYRAKTDDVNIDSLVASARIWINSHQVRT